MKEIDLDMDFLRGKGSPAVKTAFPLDADIPDYPGRKLTKLALLGVGLVGLCEAANLITTYLVLQHLK